MFLVPDFAQGALRIFQLIENTGENLVARRLRLETLRAPEFAQAVDGDAAQPTAKRTDLRLLFEFGEFAHHDGQHILHQVVGILILEGVAPQPVAN